MPTRTGSSWLQRGAMGRQCLRRAAGRRGGGEASSQGATAQPQLLTPAVEASWVVVVESRELTAEHGDGRAGPARTGRSTPDSPCLCHWPAADERQPPCPIRRRQGRLGAEVTFQRR